jgi:hypothetical protein
LAGDAEVALPVWPQETIPPDQRLFMRVERSFVKNGNFIPGAFRNRPTEQDGMSTDWERYSTPDQTRNRAAKPANNGVIEMLAGDVAGVPGQTVVHTPDASRNNRAHTDVFGVKDPEARLKLKRIARWVDGFHLA